MSLGRVIIVSFFLAILVSVTNCKDLYGQNEKIRSKVTQLDFVENDDNFTLRIVTDKRISFTSYTAEAPWKLVLEFPLTEFSNFLGEKVIEKGGIKNYIIKHVGSANNQIGRVEVNFLNKPDFSLSKTTNSVILVIKKADVQATEKTTKESVVKGEAISINNLLYSGDNNKFVVVLSSSGKPEFMSYVLKNPLRIVFDITNGKYEYEKTNFQTNNNIVKAIRVESFPNLSRIFLDIATESVPTFLAKSENDKLIIELTTEEAKIVKSESVPLLDSVDFIPKNGKVSFRFKGIGDKEYKVYKLKEDLLVFDFLGINLHKDLQKTFDTKEVNTLVKSFTLYQLKPEEERKVRFVVELTGSLPYETKKSEGDIVIEFYKNGRVKKDALSYEKVEKKEPTTPATVKKEEVPLKPVAKVEDVVKPKADEEIKRPKIEQKKEEQKVDVEKEQKVQKESIPIVQPKEEPKKEVIAAEKKEELKVETVQKVEKKEAIEAKKIEPEKVAVKKEEKVMEKPVESEKMKPLKSEEVLPSPGRKEEIKKEEKPIIVTIKPKEETKEEAKTVVKEVSSQYKGRPITINLKDAEIQHIFKLIAEVAKLDGETLNIVTSDDVKGKVSIQLDEVPWDQVLDVVMEVNNLGKKKIGNILRIMPKEKLKREQEELLASEKIREKLGNLMLEIVTINYADAVDFVDKIKPLLSSRGSVTLDKRNNSLIINDLKENIDEAKKLIAKLDTPPQQVVIEARVVEANSDFSKEMGIQWGMKFFKDFNNSRYRAGFSGASSRADMTSDATFPSGVGGGAALNLTGTGVSPVPYFVNLPASTGQGVGGGINFALVNLRSGVGLDIQLTAMENKGVGKILSRPRITTLNNIEANIQQGSSIPYETLSDKGTQTQFIDANLMLTVTPRITPDNSIILKVKVSNNNPNTALRSARGVPSIDKNEASTEILVRDGQTIVIGGIIRSKEGFVKSGVPFLMDIPVIGWLFKKEQKTLENRELLIFLTPNIIKNVIESDAS